MGLTLVRAGLLVLAAAAVYANSLSAPFIFDDEYSVVTNGAIRSFDTALSQPPNTPLAGRPVVALTFAANYAASGLAPAAYRATNIVIHIACALLLFGIVRRTLTRAATWWSASAAADLAFAAALLWVVHPLTTDAVTYVTQRTESLMGLCYLLTLYASLRSHESKRPLAWQGVAIAACAFGMGSKESMVTAPVIVVLFDRVFLFGSLRAAFTARWRLYLGLALTWVFLALQVAAAPRSGSAGFGTSVGVWTYLLNQAAMIARYLRLAVWPSDLVINYGPPIAYSLRDVLAPAAQIAGLLALTFAAFRWSPAAAFLGAWFFITLAPSSSIVPIATEVGAERRMYVPLMALATGAVLLFYRLAAARRRGIGPAALAVAAIALGAATVNRNQEHQSWLVLAQTTLERWPSDVAHGAVGAEFTRLQRDAEAVPLLRIGARSNPRSRYNLGVTLYNLKRYEEALQELSVLVREHPLLEEVPWARRVMAQSHLRLGQQAEAIAQLRMTLAMTPHDAEARRLLADTYTSRGVYLAEGQKFDEAAAEFRSALGIDPNDAGAQRNLAMALFDGGRLKEAFVETERLLALAPSGADGYHLKGKLLAMEGKYEEAVATLETALKLRPGDPAIAEDLGRVRFPPQGP